MKSIIFGILFAIVPAVAAAEVMKCEGLDAGTIEFVLTDDFQVVGSVKGAQVGVKKLMGFYVFGVKRDTLSFSFLTPTGLFHYVEAGTTNNSVVSCTLKK